MVYPPKNKNAEGKATIYINLAILAVVILVLGYFILSRYRDSSQTSGPGPGSQQVGTGIVSKSINTEKVSNFANSIQNFNLKPESYEQAQITLLNSGTVMKIGAESITEGGVDYAHFLKIENDEGKEIIYRFTGSEVSGMHVFLARQGAVVGEKISFSEIETGDDVSIQRVIDLLEGSTGEGYSIIVRRQ